jgi:23S rRNA (uracil1939-C5)-methyltransferase
MEQVQITKLVHGGQGLGTMVDGRKVFVWNALPGETVGIRVIKQKRSYVEAIAESIIVPSSERVEPKEANYLATSPWQIMTIEAENKYKKMIVMELFAHEHVAIPEPANTIFVGDEYGYRNKMEYSFWGDEKGLHLALYQRGSHGKQIVTGSSLAIPAVDAAANSILFELNKLAVRAGDLKTIIIRVNQRGEAVASLFVKTKTFHELPLPVALKGLRVYHSNPKSPASVPTKLLYECGSVQLEDMLLGEPFLYDVDSFFQVNIPVFETALKHIKAGLNEPAVTDMYAGVGSIGLSVARESVDLIELDPATAEMARSNARASQLITNVIESFSEKVLEYIVADKPVIFDPPRAGLHDKIVDHVLEVLPPKIVYLSCNPATHARDLAKLQTNYDIAQFELFNFFPHTPHIETLAILHRKRI